MPLIVIGIYSEVGKTMVPGGGNANGAPSTSCADTGQTPHRDVRKKTPARVKERHLWHNLIFLLKINILILLGFYINRKRNMLDERDTKIKTGKGDCC
jgi:hypothetical protein